MTQHVNGGHGTTCGMGSLLTACYSRDGIKNFRFSHKYLYLMGHSTLPSLFTETVSLTSLELAE